MGPRAALPGAAAAPAAPAGLRAGGRFQRSSRPSRGTLGWARPQRGGLGLGLAGPGRVPGRSRCRVRRCPRGAARERRARPAPWAAPSAALWGGAWAAPPQRWGGGREAALGRRRRQRPQHRESPAGEAPAGRAPRDRGRGCRGARARCRGPPAAAGWAAASAGAVPPAPERGHGAGTAPGLRGEGRGRGRAVRGPRRRCRRRGCGGEGQARYPGLGVRSGRGSDPRCCRVRRGHGRGCGVPRVPPAGEERLRVGDSPGWAGACGALRPPRTGTWGPVCTGAATGASRAWGTAGEAPGSVPDQSNPTLVWVSAFHKSALWRGAVSCVPCVTVVAKVNRKVLPVFRKSAKSLGAFRFILRGYCWFPHPDLFYVFIKSAFFIFALVADVIISFNF